MSKQYFRTIWISDTHLGNKNTQAGLLADFLDSTESEKLFLLGDIVDLWKMSKKGHWPKAHQDVLKKIFDKARAGTEVIYIPGNHDPFFRDFNGLGIGHISIHEEYIHQTANGQKLLLLHGDRFDEEITCARWLFHFADFLYESIITVNRHLNRIRARLNRPYWSLSGALKIRSKKVRSYITEFEQKVIAYGKEQGVDGVVCGHIHQPKLDRINGLIYANDGDWLESCSALVETTDGKLQLMDWSIKTAHHLQPATA
ncbi:UDP-2,3-diacylglucosamine diphosphatase [Gynuella sunshinyii]|uniref:Calcineurin-like phosphoesterase domain-containing protein n=1 Tax=Gynuella sunshinyii YC6258 TaxID=1445510 RepID=A0A0C5VMY0_9GAMM|nr:UDP-2,3-diacylglucosamine diphosphatase [Gynuella sunshinyii]AJQ96082.1 hypothetical protein YC6258_04046 [Gynuella sunshinyii YC6258]